MIEILETLRKIKEFCEAQNNCKECPFSCEVNRPAYNETVYHCSFVDLFMVLQDPPSDWDLPWIEGILSRD